MSQAAGRILFVTATRIGDVVLSSGLVRALLEREPSATVTIAGGAFPISLFRDTPGLERLIPITKRPYGGHWLDLWRQTREVRWSTVVDLRGSLLARVLRAERRYVFDRTRFLGRSLHKVAESAAVAGFGEAPPDPFLYCSEATEREAEAWLARTPGEGPWLAVAPAANWIGKTWPADRFAAVVSDLTGPGGALAGARVVLVGGREDRPAAEAVAAALPPERTLFALGEPDLLTCYALLKRCRMFLGNDSGMMHLAAAAGTPTLGLFGPTDDRVYAPWGAHARFVRGAESYLDFERRGALKTVDVNHMGGLSAEAVLDAARALLADTAPR